MKVLKVISRNVLIYRLYQRRVLYKSSSCKGEQQKYHTRGGGGGREGGGGGGGKAGKQSECGTQ